MSTWKLVTCLYTVEKGKGLEGKLTNNRLSYTFCAGSCLSRLGTKNAPDTQMVTMVAGGGKGVLFLTPSQGASSLQLTKPGSLIFSYYVIRFPFSQLPMSRKADPCWLPEPLSYPSVRAHSTPSTRGQIMKSLWTEVVAEPETIVRKMGRSVPPIWTTVEMESTDFFLETILQYASWKLDHYLEHYL